MLGGNGFVGVVKVVSVLSDVLLASEVELSGNSFSGSTVVVNRLLRRFGIRGNIEVLFFHRIISMKTLRSTGMQAATIE
jgi:hypothetical protein